MEGYSDIFIYSNHFWGFIIWNFNSFGGFQEKVIFFLGMMKLWIFFGVITKLEYLGVIYIFLGLFLKVKVQNWNIFGICLIFLIFFWG